MDNRNDMNLSLAQSQDCPREIPWPLFKATLDPFEYRIGLRDQRAIEFERAEIRGDWVHLTGGSVEAQVGCPDGERGVWVRLTDIVWCVDAPGGS